MIVPPLTTPLNHLHCPTITGVGTFTTPLAFLEIDRYLTFPIIRDDLKRAAPAELRGLAFAARFLDIALFYINPGPLESHPPIHLLIPIGVWYHVGRSTI
jgi:hypothetical protein